MGDRVLAKSKKGDNEATCGSGGAERSAGGKDD